MNTTCDCEWYQCCEKCIDKFDFQGKSILADIWDKILEIYKLATKGVD